MKTIILPKRGTTAQIEQCTEISVLDMLLLNYDTKELRIGDGKSLWVELSVIGIRPDYLFEVC